MQRPRLHRFWLLIFLSGMLFPRFVVAQSSSSARNNPYEIQLRSLERQLKSADPPTQAVLLRRSSDLWDYSEFGDYSLVFRQLGQHGLEISRSFHIPTQVITPSSYRDFVRFAMHIDEAERQRLTLARAEFRASNESH